MRQTRREFVRSLFVASQAALVTGSLPSSLQAAATLLEPADLPAGLNVIVFGDWGRNGQANQVEVAAQMALASQKNQTRFVLSVGDNFYEHGVASAEDPQWQSSFEKVYHAPSLQIPWQVILGNHDYHGNCEAQIAYGQTHPRWQMPARYYVKSCPVDSATTADFFYLDTTPMIRAYHENARTREAVGTQDVKKQLAWFESALAASRAQWKIVIGHHPIYSGGEHGDTAELVDLILPLLQRYQVQAYFNGHDHDLQHLQAGSVNFFCSGAGSEVRPAVKAMEHTRFAKSCSGFTTVRIQADRMQVEMIDLHGTRVYAAAVPRAT